MGNDKRYNEVIRVVKQRNNYVMLNKDFLNDKRLSFKAKGILAYLLSKPDNWKVIVKDLINHTREGKASVYAGLKELKDCGYYTKTPIRGKDGKIIYWESIVYENSEQPLTDFQDLEN